MAKWLNARLPQEQVDRAYDTLFELYQVVHIKPLVVPYEESGQELNKALQIFVRMNDGGTPLLHSDLLLSIAVAQWTKYDAREEIHGLVDEINRIGAEFGFSKDLVLKAGLMLSDIGSVGFKVDNFNRANMDTLERKWEDIKCAILLTVQLVSSFGFTGYSLTASNAILPIAHYLYMKNPGEGFLTHNSYHQDRQNIREWLVRSLLKSGVWGSGLDSLLTELRRVISEHGFDAFPITQIHDAMARRGSELTFNEEEIEDLADMRYGDRLTFALLALLFPFVDLHNQFHVDHIFPVARLTDRKLRDTGIEDEEKRRSLVDRKDSLGNLQLLQGAVNIEKSAKMPAEWLTETFPDQSSRDGYAQNHMLGDVPESISEFGAFYDARRERLKDMIGRLLRHLQSA